MSDKIKFKGKIQKVRYYSEDSSWGVCVVSTTESIPFSKLSEDYDIDTNQTIICSTVSIVGKMPHPEVGLIWDIEAHHIYSEKYKQDQYEINMISISSPKTSEDTKSYLESILTTKQAETLYSVYPTIVEDVIAGKDNVNLDLLSGFGQVTWDKAKQKIVETFAISDVISLLIPLGISFNKLRKLLDNESNPHILKEKLYKNPYKLTNIKGISFATADKIATQINPSLKESEERLICFIEYILEKIGDSDGHAYVGIEFLKSEVLHEIPECEKFLNGFIEKERIEPKIVKVENDKIGLLYYYNSEKYIYEFLNKVNESVPLMVSEENIKAGIKISEETQGFPFSQEQKDILQEMVKCNLNILSGFGGSGKSSLSRGILNIYHNAGYSIGVCALSAKAAKRASETTGFTGITIHRLLESDSISFGRNESMKLDFDIILVDECSMVNSYMFMSLFKAINNTKTKVILVGDHFQLPPIQFGQMFTDILTTENKFQKNVLTQVYRQANNSGIFIDAMKMRLGENPLTKEEMKQKRVVHGDNDMIYIFSEDKEYLHHIALLSYKKAVEQDGIENVVILCPRKKDVLNCTNQFNMEIQEELNSENMGIKFEHGKKRFLLNDRVIQVSNDKDKSIFNGYTGVVKEVNKDGIVSLFDDEIIAKHTREDINDLELANSISCHRSQGSEYESVIVVLDMNAYMLLFSEMLYTARTRGKKRVLIIAQPQAYNLCLKESKNKRSTWIKEFLNNEIPT